MELLDYLLERQDIQRLVFITDKPLAVKTAYLNGSYEIFVSCSRWQLLLHRREFLSAAENNVKLVSMRHLNEEFLKDKIVVCEDYLESKLLAALLSRRLRLALRAPVLSITQVRSGWFWKFRTLRRLQRPNRTPLAGCLPGRDDMLISIGGRCSDVYGTNYKLAPVLAVIAQYNEADIIEPAIRHLLSQGVDVHVIDNWSSDGSYEAIKAIAEVEPKRVSCERYPSKNSGKYEWEKLLNRITDLAKSRPQYKWVIFNDGDEIRWSPWPGISLQRALSFIGSLGYNCIDYTVFNFHPTADGYKRGTDPLKFFRYGEFGADNWYFLQLKTWLNNPQAEISSTGGHLVNFPGRKVFPIKFLLGHYSLRSPEQAARKILKDRQPRYLASERKRGWHVQYDEAYFKQKVIRNKKGLVKFDQDKFWHKYLLQRTFGIGIRK